MTPLKKELQGFLKTNGKRGMRSFGPYERWIREITDERLEPLRAEIFDRVDQILIAKRQEYKGIYGEEDMYFYPEIDPHEETQIKSPLSILRKIKGNWPEVNFDNFLTQLNDLVRFRVICNYLSEAKEVRDHLEVELKHSYKLVDERDYISLEPKERSDGHRGYHLICNTKDDIKFEVQVMTILQHAWDKKEHNLLYQWERIGECFPLEVRMKFFGMSELLYIADEFFDGLRGETAGKKKR